MLISLNNREQTKSITPLMLKIGKKHQSFKNQYVIHHSVQNLKYTFYVGSHTISAENCYIQYNVLLNLS